MLSGMQTISTLLNLACGGALLEEDNGRARRLQLMMSAMLFSLVFAAIWGAAAGSRSPELAVGNLYKVPMVILLSALSAVPAGMLSWRLSGSPMRGTDLLLSFTTGVFSGTLVLASLSPLVGLYYHTSAWVGPALGIGSSFLALGVATAVFLRGVVARTPHCARGLAMLVPSSVFILFLVAALVQFIAIASPILPELTPFDGGIDRVLFQ